MMFSIRQNTALLLAALCCTLTSAVRVITCDDGQSVQRLYCDSGVIKVTQALYGRTNRQTCSQGRPRRQLINVRCSQAGTLNALLNRCNGKTFCELTSSFFQTSDPCPGTFKYVDTTYSCVSATRIEVCENSLAEISCDQGQVMSIFHADYGRRDQTTCVYKRPVTEVQNIDCSNPVTASVALGCNGKNFCEVAASNQQFGDPCSGTYKYLEVAYTCS